MVREMLLLKVCWVLKEELTFMRACLAAELQDQLLLRPLKPVMKEEVLS